MNYKKIKQEFTNEFLNPDNLEYIEKIWNWWEYKMYSEIDLALAKQRSEIVEIIKEMECEPATGAPAEFNYPLPWYDGYNKSISHIISTITKDTKD